MTRCQLMRGIFDHPWISAAPQHIAACEVQPEQEEKNAGVEFISLKITKQRPSGGLVCFLSLPVKTCLKWSAWKTCITARGITPEGEKKTKHQTICFCAQEYLKLCTTWITDWLLLLFCFSSAAKYYSCSYVVHMDNATFTSILLGLVVAQAPFKMFTWDVKSTIWVNKWSLHSTRPWEWLKIACRFAPAPPRCLSTRHPVVTPKSQVRLSHDTS